VIDALNRVRFLVEGRHFIFFNPLFLTIKIVPTMPKGEIAVFEILKKWGLEHRPNLAEAIRNIGDLVENGNTDAIDEAIAALQAEKERLKK